MAMRIDAVCQEQGCEFAGGGACIRCGARLRCACGCFVREDNQTEHYKRCDLLAAIRDEERREIESTWP